MRLFSLFTHPRSFLILPLFAALLACPIGGEASASVLVTVDKNTQHMSVWVDGIEQYTWPVSTGKRGYATPSGDFTATSMNEIWYSKQWDNAPMPHSIFFTTKGHAIHGSLETKRLGTAASHGCIRLSPENAATLYTLVADQGLENIKVVVSGGHDEVAQPKKPRYPQYGQAGPGGYPYPPPYGWRRGRGYYAPNDVPPPWFRRQQRRRGWFQGPRY